MGNLQHDLHVLPLACLYRQRIAVERATEVLRGTRPHE
jgi:hypothetical protein